MTKWKITFWVRKLKILDRIWGNFQTILLDFAPKEH